MFQEISVEELLGRLRNGEFSVIDVRSPSEFAEMTIPGSRNVPLFNDEERREVGTLYKQDSVEAAKEKGLEIVSRKLPAFIKEMEGIPGRKAVFCWRGGMRSRTAATLLDLYGLRAYRLSGGIRAYRRFVVQALEEYRLQMPCIVLNGYTGTGKTKILRLLSELGEPVLDLEGLAGHRGSIFGQVGLAPNNQKTFDSLLLHELIRLEGAPYILVEAESKRVGRVVLPEFLTSAKDRGMQYFIELPMEERVRNIIEDYQPETYGEVCLEAFRVIKRKIHTPIAQEIESHLMAGRYPEAVELLLVHYYDPRYEYAAQQYEGEPIRIKAENAEDACGQIRARLDAVRGKSEIRTKV